MLAFVLTLCAMRAAADQPIGGNCSVVAGDSASNLNGNNAWCNGSTWQYPAYWLGSTTSGCSSSTAGLTQFTGTAVSPNNTFEFCNGSSWQVLGTATSLPLSGLTAATTGNIFDSSANAQTWEWGTLSTGTALTITTSSMTTGTLLSLQDTAISNTSTGVVLSISDTTTGPGYGISSVMSGKGNTGYAGYFSNTSSTGAGYALYVTTSTTGAGYAIYGTLPLPGNTGYAGYFTNSGTGTAYGLLSTIVGAANTGYAGYFTNTATSGINYGIYGSNASASGYGGYFKNTSTGYAVYSSGNAYVNGNIIDANVTSCNVLGTNSNGQLICEGGPAMTLISAQTASNSASLQWTGLGSTYYSYKLICTDVFTSSGSASVYLQFGEGSTPTWETSNYVFYDLYTCPACGGASDEFSNGTSAPGIYLENPGSPAASPGAAQFDLTIGNLASSYNKGVIGDFNAPQGGTNQYSYAGTIWGVYGGDTNAVTAIRILPSTGTLSTGTCSLYGLSTSGGSNAVGGGGSVPLSGLTSALTSVSFDNSSYGQTWTWNSLSTGTAMTLSSSSITSGNVLSVQATASGNTGTALYALNDSTSGWGIYSAGTSPNYFAGDVGIGTTSPFSNWSSGGGGIDVYNGTNAILRLAAANGNTSSLSDFGNRLEIATNTNIGFSVSGPGTTDTALWIDSTGVGIGTTSPSSPLTVAGINSQYSNPITLLPSTYSGSIHSEIDFNTSDWAIGEDFNGNGTRDFFIVNNNVGFEDLYISASNQLSIGTVTPVSLLTVNGDIDLAASSYLNFGSTDGTNGYGFRDSGGTMQRKNSGGSWATISTSSDQRLKRDIIGLPEIDGLAAIMKLRPVLFHWKDVEKDKEEGEQVGLIAQDVEKVFPSSEGITYNFGNVTMTLPSGKREAVEHARGMNYERLVAPLIKAVQEQETEIEELRGEVAALKARGGQN